MYHFSRNLPFDIGEDELSQVFDKYGELCYARLVTDKLTGHPKGISWIYVLGVVKLYAFL